MTPHKSQPRARNHFRYRQGPDSVRAENITIRRRKKNRLLSEESLPTSTRARPRSDRHTPRMYGNQKKARSRNWRESSSRQLFTHHTQKNSKIVPTLLGMACEGSRYHHLDPEPHAMTSPVHLFSGLWWKKQSDVSSVRRIDPSICLAGRQWLASSTYKGVHTSFQCTFLRTKEFIRLSTAHFYVQERSSYVFPMHISTHKGVHTSFKYTFLRTKYKGVHTSFQCTFIRTKEFKHFSSAHFYIQRSSYVFPTISG